jgi:hypothetical protein
MAASDKKDGPPREPSLEEKVKARHAEGTVNYANLAHEFHLKTQKVGWILKGFKVDDYNARNYKLLQDGEWPPKETPEQKAGHHLALSPAAYGLQWAVK